MAQTSETAIFAARLNHLVDRSGKSINAIYKETGINRANISKYINDLSEASLSNVVRLANYFSVSTDYLLGRTDQCESSSSNSFCPLLRAPCQPKCSWWNSSKQLCAIWKEAD